MNAPRYFDHCATVETTKAEFRRLAKIHHPDLGGDGATMADLIAAYHARLKSLDGQESHGDDGRAHRYQYQEAREQEIVEKLSELLRTLPAGVELALIGLWLWITGTTREDKATQAALKAAGCMWHSKRMCWYWRPASIAHRGRQSRGSLDDLANRYGCRNFTTGAERETAPAVA